MINDDLQAPVTHVIPPLHCHSLDACPILHQLGPRDQSAANVHPAALAEGP